MTKEYFEFGVPVQIESLRVLRDRWHLDSALPSGIAAVAAVTIGAAVAWAMTREAWQLLILAALVGLAPILLRWPVIVAFGAYAFMLPFDSVAFVVESGVASVTKLVGIVAAGVLLATGVAGRRLVRPPLASLWVMLLFTWAMVTLVWALNLTMSRAQLLTVVSIVAMYLVAVSYRVSEKELMVVCVLTMVGGAVAATAGVILGFEADTPRAMRGTLAVAGRETNPNAVAQTLILPLATACAMFLWSRRLWGRIVAVVAIAAIAAGIFLTMSRASMIAVAIMMCLLLYRYHVRWQVLVVPGILVALVPFMPELFFERVRALFTGQDATGAGRTEIWNVGLNSLDKFGWLGAGLANYPAVFNMYAFTPPRGTSFVAHNTFLGTWVELGIVGFALLLVMLIAHLRMTSLSTRVTASSHLRVAIEAACIGFLVLAFFGDVLWRKAFWAPWILAVWASRRELDRSTV